jgi:[protein-PII] uridylyltransferase
MSGINGPVAVADDDPATSPSMLVPGPSQPGGVGAAAREERAAALHAWLADLLDRAAPDAMGSGLALVALGGMGRRECAPNSDVDLVLLHDGRTDVGSVAERIWYPIWDAGLSLDHSVRTMEEVLAVAAADTKAGLGLLDARHLSGDAELTARLREETQLQWRRTARAHLPVLRELTTQRWRHHGELAFLLDGDIKEARGGLRDVRVLRGIAYAHVSDAWRPPVRAAYTRLLDVRDCLHLVAGRRRDRVFVEDLDEVATLLGITGPVALRRRIADDARAIAYAVDDSLRAAERWLAAQRQGGRRMTGPVARVPVAPDVVAQDGEVVLARNAVSPTVDPTLSLRVAAAAARHGLRISPGTLEWLARRCPPLPRPWPGQARAAMAQLLGTGPALVSTWEACDRFGLVTAWLPEWARVRSAPQHNPVHRFTLDRHLIECVAAAARHARDVARPDLLFLAALLHDIGKGLPGDHSVVGVGIACGVAEAIGLPPGEVEAIGRLVRWHLLLPDVATRRDLGDPETVRHVAEKVGDSQTLELLHALSRADAVATGPAARSAWKERLVADLVARVRAALVNGAPPSPPGEPARLSLATGPLPAVEITPDRVIVAAVDRLGLLASVAGCLTLHRLDVVSADTATVTAPAGEVAVVACRVQRRDAAGPDRRRLAGDLARAVCGELRVDEALTARVRSTSRPRGGAAREAAPPRVVWAVDGATDATILELRASDDVGLLYRVAHALELAGAIVRAARISTLGADVVDAFYLVGDWSAGPARSDVERAVLAAAAPS